MRFVALVLMAALAIIATVFSAPADDEFGPAPATEVPPISICPIVENAASQTEVAVLSSINGAGRLSTFSSGSETGAVDFSTGGTGSVIVPAAEAGAVNFAGGLVEMPSEATASGVVMRGDESLAAEACADIPTGQAFITGGSTASGQVFQLQLVNPYAGEAQVDLVVTTDAGIESDERFDVVNVPPLSSITLDFAEIIGGRETVSVNIETLTGAVLAFGRQTSEGRTAVWRAVEPGQDWWIPAPPGGGTKQLRIGSPNAAEVEYQVDLYGPDGFVESHATGVIEPRGRLTVPMAGVTDQELAMRVITTAPVVPTLWIDSPSGLAATVGSQVDAPVWLLPGASLPPGGSGQIVVLNTGLEAVTVTTRSLRVDSLVRNYDLASEDLLVVDMIEAEGYRVESTGPVVAMWAAQLNGAGTAALGFPIQDG
jgi:hypothetical protein